MQDCAVQSHRGSPDELFDKLARNVQLPTGVPALASPPGGLLSLQHGERSVQCCVRLKGEAAQDAAERGLRLSDRCSRD